MVYIASDGTVVNGPRPWDLKRIKDTFWSFVHGVELFIQTLIPFPLPGSSNNNRAVRFRSTGYIPGSGGPRNPSNRPTGGFRTMSDIRPPPPAFGGCSGGSCGM